MGMVYLKANTDWKKIQRKRSESGASCVLAFWTPGSCGIMLVKDQTSCLRAHSTLLEAQCVCAFVCLCVCLTMARLTLESRPYLQYASSVGHATPQRNKCWLPQKPLLLIQLPQEQSHSRLKGVPSIQRLDKTHVAQGEAWSSALAIRTSAGRIHGALEFAKRCPFLALQALRPFARVGFVQSSMFGRVDVCLALLKLAGHIFNI